MNETTIEDKINSTEIKTPDKQSFITNGDLTALRVNNKGQFYRSNYLRGLLLYSLIIQYQPKTILEFGTGRGFGALSMARAIIDANLNSQIYTIDFRQFNEKQKWPIDYGSGPQVESLSLKDIWEKYFPQQLIDKITLLTGKSHEVINEWKTNQFPSPDFIFIDGGHDYLSVKHDYYATLNISNSNFKILFDDYVKKPKFGICKLVDEEIEPIFDTTLIKTYSEWHPSNKSKENCYSSNMVLIDSDTSTVPIETYYKPNDIQTFLKNYKFKFVVRQWISKFKSKLLKFTIKPIWRYFRKF
tara:strand:+ start:2222 stop:3121 length:900 start_codon:yes stop_codon:yes gene_type:complete